MGQSNGGSRLLLLVVCGLALALFAHCDGSDSNGGNAGRAGSGAGAAGSAGRGGGAGSGGSAGADASDDASVTIEIGPAGGTVTGPDGAELVVPAGALSAPVRFSVTKNPSDAPSVPAGWRWLGDVYGFTPHGTVFATPATVRIPIDSASVPAELEPTAFKAEPGGAFSHLPNATVTGSAVEAQVSTLSFFASGVPFSFLGTMKPTDVAAYPGGGAVVVALGAGVTRVVKVTETGGIAWDRTTQGTPTFTQALPRVAVGPTGNVYVATSTSTDEAGTSLGGPVQVRITAYNPSGDVRAGWPVRISLHQNNFPTDIVTDAQDNVYVVGTQSSNDFTAHDSYRPFLASYRENGTVISAARVVNMGGTEPGRRILSQSVALAPNGSIYMNAQVVPFVASSADPGAGTRLIAFDLQGAVVSGYPIRLSQTTTSSQMVVDRTGICYVLESNDERLHAINPNGTNVAGFPQAVTLPATGSHFVSGFSAAENAFAVSVTGNLYFVGSAREQPGNPGPQGSGDGYLQSLDTTGAQRARFPIYLSTPAADSAMSVAMDAAGANAWVAWYIEAAPAQGFVTRIPAN
jgi:hypothetical protein